MTNQEINKATLKELQQSGKFIHNNYIVLMSTNINTITDKINYFTTRNHVLESLNIGGQMAKPNQYTVQVEHTAILIERTHALSDLKYKNTK